MATKKAAKKAAKIKLTGGGGNASKGSDLTGGGGNDSKGSDLTGGGGNDSKGSDLTGGGKAKARVRSTKGKK